MLQMGGTAAVVDVDAVGVDVDEVRHHRQTLEQVGRRRGGSAVGAVHQHTQPGQVAADGVDQMVHIVVVHLLRAVAAAAQLTAGLDGHLRTGQDQLLHSLLHGVRQLIALGIEHLDAVVLIGVVAGGDHHTGVRLLLHRQEGHGRRGNGAQQ